MTLSAAEGETGNYNYYVRQSSAIFSVAVFLFCKGQNRGSLLVVPSRRLDFTLAPVSEQILSSTLEP